MTLSKPEKLPLKFFPTIFLFLNVGRVYLGPELWVELGKLVPGDGWTGLTHGLEGVARALQEGR